ncbi:MAG: CHRD domain-containing protein [Bacteroidota bacterium]
MPRFLSLRLLVFLLAVGLAACDSYGDDYNDDDASGNASQTGSQFGDPSASGTTLASVSGEVNFAPLQDQFLTAALTGEAEVGEGDPDGSGKARVLFFPNRNLACFQLNLTKVGEPTRVHIHQGAAGVNGPIAISFFDTVVENPVPAPPNLIGCVTAERDVIERILANPANYYVNVHTEAYPAGAVRGQLYD